MNDQLDMYGILILAEKRRTSSKIIIRITHSLKTLVIIQINAMNDTFTNLRDVGKENLPDIWSTAMLITSIESRREEAVTSHLRNRELLQNTNCGNIYGSFGNNVVLKATSKSETVTNYI